MNIGVIGWWNYDNQGDLAMLDALRQGLAPHHVVPLDVGFPAHADTLHRLNRFDYVLLGGGTLISRKPAPPFDTFDSWAAGLEVPLGVVGLGVDPILESYLPAVKALIDRARFFVVRDHVSWELLGRTEVQVAPDLTFVYPLPLNREVTGAREGHPLCGVNLRESPRLDPRPWLEVIRGLPVALRAIPLSSFESFDETALLRRLDPGGARAYSPALYEGLDLMIGTAFHSVLFAVQAGVPVIAIAYAPKVRNFMEGVGLGPYVLSTEESERLPDLVDEVLARRSSLAQEVRRIREELHREARAHFRVLRSEVEGRDRNHVRTGPPVTIMVLSCGNPELDDATLASCLSQTYENRELLFLPRGQGVPLPSLATGQQVRVMRDPLGEESRLEQALRGARGAYLSWVEGGDWLAEDAVDCLVHRMEQDPGLDMLYADYWLLSERRVPVGVHHVPDADKLYRRDVVGPCFLVRQRVVDAAGGLPADSPLATYRLWLQMRPRCRFVPFHAPLMYSARQPHSPAVVKRERATRRRWRDDRPRWQQTLWRIIDSDAGERYLVQPVARLRRWLRRGTHGQHI